MNKSRNCIRSPSNAVLVPLLNAGVTPALISHVCTKLINIYPVIVPLGIGAKPYFNHLVVEAVSYTHLTLPTNLSV